MKGKLLAIFLVVTLFTACARNTAAPQTEGDSPPNPAIAAYTVESKTVSLVTQADIIKLLIPQLSSKGDTDFTNVNQMIYEEAVSYLAQFDKGDLSLSNESEKMDWKNAAYEDFALSGEYEIKYSDDAMLSVVFVGLWNVKSAPHPNNFSFSINIDLQTAQRIDARTMYRFDEAFVEQFRANEESWTLQEYPSANFISEYFGAQLADMFAVDKDTYYYFTESKLGIILAGLPFAAGDYCPVEIPYEDMAQFKK
ncbi:MAG: DUF4163 domain-containing protein [Oscillospiraceae bacterium]|nr:DUF4163 domain-containing protein [Oscillospiraceae bacterium]